MTKYFAAYAATLVLMVALDLVWLGVIAKPLYQQAIGHLMAERPNIPVALIFYAVYAFGLMVFAVTPDQSGPGWSKAILVGALFGFFAYATYDLTNLATLKNWPVSIALVDVLWGTFVSAASAGVGRLALDRFGAA